MFSRRHHRHAAFATLCLMVLALLAPGVSRAVAFASGQGAPWGEICRASDERRATPADQAPGALADAMDACALCVLGHDAPPLPAMAALPALLPVTVGDAPPGFLQAPRALLARHNAQPRAPPSFFVEAPIV